MSSKSLERGAILGNYWIESILRSGGFGVTYLARHSYTNQLIEIIEYFPYDFATRSNNKVSPCSSDKERIFRWGLQNFREVAKKLETFTGLPNTITFRDYFEANGTAYIVTNHFEGETFDQLLRQHAPLNQQVLLKIFIPILDALRRIHTKDYLYLDMSPSSIFLCTDNTPLLIDFSATKRISAIKDDDEIILRDGYAPFEQYSRNGNKGIWTDIYAVGATLWAAINGAKSPPSATDREDAWLAEQPDPLRPATEVGRGHYSESFLKAIDWALALKVKDRPQTIQAFQDMLVREDSKINTYAPVRQPVFDIQPEVPEIVERMDALPKGYEIDRYRIERTLGEGGFGITYLAHHIRMGDPVAIKEYLPNEFASREAGSTVLPRSNGKAKEVYDWGLQRFLDEAKTLAKFKDHPNIVTVRDYFEENGTAYLVMQYERGKSLDKWLKTNPQPTQQQLLEIFIPILDGLREVHAQQYLHRDIKPGNIYLRHDGRPLLIDFGASRLALGEQARSLTNIVTPGYTPKEQYSTRGNQGAWTDIYAVGATLWRAVSGKEPPLASDRGEARDDGYPDPLTAASEIGRGRYSENFLMAIDWSLAYLPKDRPQTVREWQDMLLKEWQ